MARGTALSTLVTMLKAEIGDYSGTNTARDNALMQLLSNMQTQLALEYKWSFLIRRWDVQVPGGTQYVTFPTVDIDGESSTMNLDELKTVQVYWNTIYQEMEYGIGADQYNAMNPTLGNQSDPIQRWRERSNVDESVDSSQFEVWPLPASTQTVRFEGERELKVLAVSTDVADLDDLLIVLAVAANQLARTKQADAQLMATRFNRRLKQLGQRSRTDTRTRVLGSGSDMVKPRLVNVNKLIAVH
jgi:hypothetical protein